MSVLVQYLKFLKSSPGENEKKEKTAELPGYAPSVAGSIDNEKKDEDELTSSITDHGLAAQETPKNINASSAEPVAMRSSSSAAAPAFTQPVANPGRGYNTGVPRPQTQQQPTKIPRVLESIPMANSVNDPRSGTLLDKQGSLGYSRNTGISDVEGEIYVNGNDVELLGKLGFEYSCEEYLGLEKTSEVLDVYSYIEKVAGVPKEVTKLIDAGQAFSGEYLKDMGYTVPKGYEVKGDLVCPVEKTEQSFQQDEKEKKGSFEKTAAANPAQTILITGHSGSGKTTLSRQLAEKLKLPVYRVDAQQSWDDLREHFGKNPELERKALIPGSAENKKYVKDIRKIVHKSLKEINGPAILEGTQLTTLPAKQLEKYRASIVVGGDMSQSIAQRLQRAADKAAAKGITFSPEQLAKKREESQLVADSWHPGIEKFKKLPGVINYNHTEHQMKPLVKQLKQLMNKQAEYKWHKSKDLHRDVTNGRHYPFSFLAGEAKELVDAIKKRDMANFKEEIGDTSYAAQMLAAQATGLNHPVYADLSKFHNREKIWKDIFREKGSTYHPKHMEGGSNFAKPSKIIKALASAGIRISQKEAEKLANKYTGGKMEKEAAAPTQHFEGESVKPFGGLSRGMGGGVGLQGQNTAGDNQPALRPAPPQLRPMPAPEPVNPAFTLTTGGPLAIDTNPINIPTENLAQQNPPSVGTIAKELIPGPADLLPVATAVMTKKIAPFVPYNLRKKLTRFNVGANVGSGELNAFGRDDDSFGKWLDRANAFGGAMSVVPNPYVAVPGAIISGSATALNLGREFQKARRKYSGPPILGGNKPAFPTFNAPAVTPQQQPAYQLQKLSEADHPVTSSNIKAVGHDTKKKILEVAFHSGSEYIYKNVPRSLYDRLLKAKSPGKFFNKHIKKDKPFEYEKVAGMPEHIRRAIATGDKALLQAAQSRSVASRAANIAAKKRKLEIAKLLGAEEPKLLQRGEEFQKHFPFSVSHEFEQAKKIVDPSYRPDLSKYLGRMES